MVNNKKSKSLKEYNSYLVNFNITLLVQTAENKKDAFTQAARALKEQKYLIREDLIDIKKYE